jgi:hypothetical protein
MRWDRFFEDIEDQLDSEWEAERVALETEAERLRLSRVALRERLEALVPVDADAPAVSLELVDGTVVRAPVAGVGADWLLAAPWGSRAGAALIPLAALTGIGMAHADLLRTARPQAASAAGAVSRRATLGFAVRDLVRRRTGVTVHTLGGRSVSGTVDRAGTDHLDLAVHEPGAVRRASEVTGYRLVPFSAVAWIAVHAYAAA